MIVFFCIIKNIYKNMNWNFKMEYTKVVCYDLELCCWEGASQRVGEIIEIGVVEVNLEKREILRENQYLVIPEKDEISEYCTRLTTHTSKKIKKQGRPLESVIKSIEKKYGFNKPYLAWGNDGNALANEMKDKNIENNFKNLINFAMIYNLLNCSKKSSGQLEAMKKYNVPFVGRQHVAINDAKNMALFLLEFTKKHNFCLT